MHQTTESRNMFLGMLGAYHLAKNSGNFGLKSNGKAIFRKFHPKFVDNLQRYSTFSVRNGKSEIFLPFAQISVSRPSQPTFPLLFPRVFKDRK